ncbi:hypothetical protein [Nocardioides sp. SYSU DS0651]|uniref:hypothetical protein n=1 Tax=Nocardioides sp. SYSU DS0651 TaxID=3415955 RepID=UPI003F4B12DA
MSRLSRRSAVDLLLAAVPALVVLGPLLAGPGYWLVGDMVFVPEQPWKAAWLGLDGSLPRAVPMDALVSLATQVVPGSVVQRLLLVGGFLLGGVGVARLVGDHRWYARAAAVLLLCWNPWVYERLLIGQWAILLGYFLLPWVALAALRLRRDPRAWGRSAWALTASAVCSPSSGVMAVAVLAVLALGRDPRTWWRAAAVAVVANLTWAVPALTAPSVQVSTEGVFEGFAARAESAAGVAASLLSLGGIWKTAILPGERTSAVVVLLSCLVSVAALVGLRRARRGRQDLTRWLGLAGGAYLVALAPAVPGGAGILEAAGDVVPGLALLRDSHRFLAPLGLVLAVGAAGAATGLAERVRPGTGALWSGVALVVVAPVLLLPSLAWGAAGELERSSYPAAWSDVAALVGEEPDDGATVVLPWAGSYRGFDWNHRRAVLDPAPRLLPGVVLVDDSVLLRDRVVPVEDPRVRSVGEALDAATPEAAASALRAAGVRWVLVEEGMAAGEAPAGRVVHDAAGLRLVDLAAGGPVAGPPSTVVPAVAGWRRWVVGLGHAATFLLVCFAFHHHRGHTSTQK